MYVAQNDPSDVEAGEHFARIASQLRQGVSAPAVRDQLIAAYGFSRLQAGKLVEDVVRGVRIARMNLVSGAFLGLLGAAGLAFVGDGLLFWGLLVGGGVQFAAGYKTLAAYRSAVWTAPGAG